MGTFSNQLKKSSKFSGKTSKTFRDLWSDEFDLLTMTTNGRDAINKAITAIMDCNSHRTDMSRADWLTYIYDEYYCEVGFSGKNPITFTFIPKR